MAETIDCAEGILGSKGLKVDEGYALKQSDGGYLEFGSASHVMFHGMRDVERVLEHGKERKRGGRVRHGGAVNASQLMFETAIGAAFLHSLSNIDTLACCLVNGV